MQCSCSHLTDFAAVFPAYNRVPLKQVLALTSDNIASYPGGLITVMVVVTFFGLFVAMAMFRDHREKRMEQVLRTQKLNRWEKAAALSIKISSKIHFWKQFKNGDSVQFEQMCLRDESFYCVNER